MSRLFTSGAETGALASDGLGPTGSPAVVTTPVRTGTYSVQIQTSSSVTEAVSFLAGATNDRDYYLRQYVRFDAAPANATSIIQVVGTDFASLVGSVRLETDRTLTLRDKNNAQVGSASAALSVDTWYRIELNLRTKASDANGGKLDLRINGDSQVSSTTATLGILAPFIWYCGPGATAVQTTASIYFDDLALNDDQSSDQNAWPGPGKIVLLKPISDNARVNWVAGAGSTSNLWDALNNRPPVGVALASATNTSQIKDATNNNTDTYDANVETYTTAGITSSDLIKVVLAISTGGTTVTGGRTVTAKLQSNPSGTELTTSTSTIAGTFPSNWYYARSAAVYAPSVTLGTSPVVRVRKGTAGTDSLMYCSAGVLVDYVPDTGAITPNITVGPSVTKISRVSSKDITTFSFQADQEYDVYELRVVPATSSPHTAGTLIETGGTGPASVNRNVDVTDDELVAASGVEGDNIIKAFVRSYSGVWST